MRKTSRAAAPVICVLLGFASPLLAAGPARETAHETASPDPAALGRIEIPRLGLFAPVREGAEGETLRVAVGHIGGTALPGEKGNAGLAAHRNTFFRPLRDVKVGDQVVVTTAGSAFEYRVESIAVVDPTDVSVLDPTPKETLTLVTCYPFDWVGDAPQRLIVKAARLP